jgi:multiple RNA-binding domain-containing protein 1
MPQEPLSTGILFTSMYDSHARSRRTMLTICQTDAVMSTIANRMGISKAELLDPTSSDAAVKQAHAETHIIQETKSYFAQHGVDLEAFQRSSKGDLAILVKNVPHGVTADELRKLFEEHGTVTKFLVPPTGMTAIIEYANVAQAKTAFMSLSYRKMKDSILYLEKAPKDLFKEGAVVDMPRAIPAGNSATKLSATDLLEDAPEPESATTATLYVRNLNFSTTTERLTEAFKPLSGFRSAKVKTKVDPKRGVLSMGFGFVEFSNADAAAAALRSLDGHDLEGHKLQIKASHKGADAAEERRKDDAAKKAASTKIIVKNLPFEAGVGFIYPIMLARANLPCRKRIFALCSPLTANFGLSGCRRSSTRLLVGSVSLSSLPSAMQSTL